MNVQKPRRVAFFLSTSGHSGVDRIARNLLPEIARRGYAVDLLKVRRHGPELGPEAVGIRVIDTGSRSTFGALPALVRYLRHERPDVLFSDKDKVNRLALLAHALARVKTELVFRSGTTISVDVAHRTRFDRWMQRLSMKYLYRHARALVVPSVASAKDHIRFAGLQPERVHVLPSPVVPARVLERPIGKPDHPWFAAGCPPVVLGVGELSARKDFATLVRAFALVRRDLPCRLVILGSGREMAALRQLAADLKVSEDVDFAGFQADVFPFMAHAAVFALTSRWEGMPVALIEALACGTPVMATDCAGGSRELLRDGKLGPLLPIGDDRLLAVELRRLLQTPKASDPLREAARPYGIEAATTAYLAVMGLPAHAEGGDADQRPADPGSGA